MKFEKSTLRRPRDYRTLFNVKSTAYKHILNIIMTPSEHFKIWSSSELLVGDIEDLVKKNSRSTYDTKLRKEFKIIQEKNRLFFVQIKILLKKPLSKSI